MFPQISDYDAEEIIPDVGLHDVVINSKRMVFYVRVTSSVRERPHAYSVFPLGSIVEPLHLTYLVGEQRACLSSL